MSHRIVRTPRHIASLVARYVSGESSYSIGRTDSIDSGQLRKMVEAAGGTWRERAERNVLDSGYTPAWRMAAAQHYREHGMYAVAKLYEQA